VALTSGSLASRYSFQLLNIDTWRSARAAESARLEIV
jgi:hypothetical protein